MAERFSFENWRDRIHACEDFTSEEKCDEFLRLVSVGAENVSYEVVVELLRTFSDADDFGIQERTRNVVEADIVVSSSIDGELFVSSVAGRGCHSTLRVFAEVPGIRTSILQQLRRLGADCAVTKGLSLFAVDIPPAVDFKVVDEYLEAISDGESISYEDACLQHSGIDNTRIEECKLLAAVPPRLA